jgi:hypothetical protein
VSHSTRGQLPQLAPSWWIRAGGGGSLATVGSRAAFDWLGDRKIPRPSTRWHVAIGLDVRDEPAPASFDEATDSRFHIEIYAEEWGFFFCTGGRASWIRITDVPFVHMRDDFGLRARVLPLPEIGSLLRALEAEHGLAFKRELAYVNTSLSAAESLIRAWIASL